MSISSIKKQRVSTSYPVRDKFLPFTQPSTNDAEKRELLDCLDSGWLATGPRVSTFQQQLASYLATSPENVFLHTSGTSSLYLALKVLNLQPGDEVITTPLTFVATANAIVEAGGKPVFVDIDPQTFNICPQAVERAITAKTRAILPVHFAGLPVDLSPLMDLASTHNLIVIEDAAHAIGASYKNQKIGHMGHMQIFSFHPNKNLSTGEGGALICHLPQYHQRLAALTFHGIDRNKPQQLSTQGNQIYDVLEPSLKHNMSDLQAALGIHQLKELDERNAKRATLASLYRQAFSSCAEINLPQKPGPDYAHAWHMFSICLNESSPLNRSSFIDEMKSLNIGIGIHYEPVHLFTYYRHAFGYKEGDLPKAEWIGKRICSLPLFPNLTKKDVEGVIGAVYSVLN